MHLFSPEVGRVLDLLGLQQYPRVSNWRFSPSPKHLAVTLILAHVAVVRH